MVVTVAWLRHISRASSPMLTSPWVRMVLRDRKSTRLNSSHVANSYAVFCLKKKTNNFRGRGHHGTSVPGAGPILGPALAVCWGWSPAVGRAVVGGVVAAGVGGLGTLVSSHR